MRVRVGGVERRGRAIDLRDVDVTADAVLAAVRDPDDDCLAAPPPRTVEGDGVAAESSLHERVGFLYRDVTISTIPAVAAAARSRGATTEYDAELRRLSEELAGIDAPAVDLAAARERVAETAEDVERLRERVARASGRVEARRAADEDAADAQSALETATQELAERETEHHAAREALAAARERARDARNARERRLELEDRLGNLQRAARRELAGAFGESFRRAVAALPVPGEPARPSEFAGPDWAAACAIARIARVRTPLVVAAGFEDAGRARAALDAPVLLVEL
jgi:hypothetical protein